MALENPSGIEHLRQNLFFFFSWYERCESEYLSEVETQNSFLDHIESLNLDLISEMKVSMVSTVLAVS